jgi:hypothetical protein
VITGLCKADKPVLRLVIAQYFGEIHLITDHKSVISQS